MSVFVVTFDWAEIADGYLDEDASLWEQDWEAFGRVVWVLAKHRRARHAGVAQSIERAPSKREVVGANPTPGTTSEPVA